MNLGPIGACFRSEGLAAPEAADAARRLERFGYSALWLTDSLTRDPLVHASWLLAATDALILATGIANIYLRTAVAVSGAQRALAEQSGGRFILGLGVSHPEMITGLLSQTYERPLSAMTQYLDSLESAPYAGPAFSEELPVVLAALGPKMLALAAKRSAGAFPVQVTPEYTARARAVLGPEPWLCIKQYVVLESNPVSARNAARERLGRSLSYGNYRRNLASLGFRDDDFANGGSDRLVDGIIAIGNETAVRDRITAHRAAGATHVCIEPIDVSDPRKTDFRALEALAPAG